MNTTNYEAEALPEMTDYSHPKYKNLYKEILDDVNFRYGKFSSIPYPLYTQLQEEK